MTEVKQNRVRNQDLKGTTHQTVEFSSRFVWSGVRAWTSLILCKPAEPTFGIMTHSASQTVPTVFQLLSQERHLVIEFRTGPVRLNI